MNRCATDQSEAVGLQGLAPSDIGKEAGQWVWTLSLSRGDCQPGGGWFISRGEQFQFSRSGVAHPQNWGYCRFENVHL